MTTLSPVRIDLVGAWESALRAELVERDEEIHLFAVALAAREHLFLLGEPGLAKTMVIERGVAYIGGVRVYIVQLGQMSTRDETEGPVSLKGLAEDEYRRIGKGYTTECEIVVWDEGFKASKSLTNSGLRFMNERMHNDNGVNKPIPLSTFVVTSNEERQSDEQEAFDDRLLLRKIVTRPTDRANVIRMLMMDDPDPAPAPVMEWADWVAVQAATKAMPVAMEVYEMIADLERELLAAGIKITPRRLRKCVRIIQAEACLEGASQAEPEHAAILENCAWVESKDQPKAQQIVLAKASPVLGQSLALLQQLEAHGKEIDGLLAAAKANDGIVDTNLASELQGKLKRSKKKARDLDGVGGGGRRNRELVERCVRRADQLMTTLLVEAFDVSLASLRSDLD